MFKDIIKTIGLIFLLLPGFLPVYPRTEQFQYNNPLIRQRADPWIHRTECGIYYFVATVPEYDRIEMRKAETINGLADAEPVVIWRKHESGPMSHHIWAPELHRINGKWYIYFAAGRAAGYYF